MAGLAAGAVWVWLTAQWQVIWLGLAAITFSPYIIPLLMIPAGILSHFMTIYQAAARRGKEQLMFVLSVAHILLMMTLWCVGIFIYVTHSVRPEFTATALLWANVTAMTPLLIWINRDRANIFILFMVETAQAALWVLMLAKIWGDITSFWGSFLIFFGIIAGVAAIQGVYEEKFKQKPAPPSC